MLFCMTAFMYSGTFKEYLPKLVDTEVRVYIMYGAGEESGRWQAGTIIEVQDDYIVLQGKFAKGIIKIDYITDILIFKSKKK